MAEAKAAVGFIGQPARSEADAELRKVFMEAKALTVRIGTELSQWRDPGGEDSFTFSTLRKIEMGARVNFAAACSLLFEDWLAYGADNHLKSLLEAYAHCAWILGKGGLNPPMRARARALCYELGMVNALRQEASLSDELTERLGATGRSNLVEGPEKAYRHLLSMHAPDGCACQGNGRGWWNAKRTLEDLSRVDASKRADGAEWMYVLWKYASRVEHHSGFERMLRADHDRVWMGWAEPWQRVRTLSALVQVYGSIVAWVGENYDKDVAKTLVQALSELMARPAVHEAWATLPQSAGGVSLATAQAPSASPADAEGNISGR